MNTVSARQIWRRERAAKPPHDVHMEQAIAMSDPTIGKPSSMPTAGGSLIHKCFVHRISAASPNKMANVSAGAIVSCIVPPRGQETRVGLRQIEYRKAADLQHVLYQMLDRLLLRPQRDR